jgi:hypothetical protein
VLVQLLLSVTSSDGLAAVVARDVRLSRTALEALPLLSALLAG